MTVCRKSGFLAEGGDGVEIGGGQKVGMTWKCIPWVGIKFHVYVISRIRCRSAGIAGVCKQPFEYSHIFSGSIKMKHHLRTVHCQLSSLPGPWEATSGHVRLDVIVFEVCICKVL